MPTWIDANLLGILSRDLRLRSPDKIRGYTDKIVDLKRYNIYVAETDEQISRDKYVRGNIDEAKELQSNSSK